MIEIALALKLPSVDLVLFSRLVKLLHDKYAVVHKSDYCIDLFVSSSDDDTLPLPLLPKYAFRDVFFWSGEVNDIPSEYHKAFCPRRELAAKNARLKHIVHGYAEQLGIKNVAITSPWLQLPKTPEGFFVRSLLLRKLQDDVCLFVDLHDSLCADLDTVQLIFRHAQENLQLPLVTYRELLPRGNDMEQLIREYCMIRQSKDPWRIMVDLVMSSLLISSGNSWTSHVAETLKIPSIVMYIPQFFSPGRIENYRYHSQTTHYFNGAMRNGMDISRILQIFSKVLRR